jgi:hypothetical protein
VRETPDPTEALVERAKADLAAKLDVRRDQITAASVEEARFPDASLGVAEPGRAYAQVVTPGYVIELIAGDTVYEYHAGDGRVVLASGEGDTGDEILVVEGVRVASGQIRLSGSTLLPDGTCLQARLYVDDEPASWWPVEECIPVQDGKWQTTVALGESGAPEELDPLLQYRLDVWQKADPSVETAFWFDLYGPPAP